MFWVFWARGLSRFAGGELLFAWFRRSSAALSLASRASSSLVWVVTACFLRACQPAPSSGQDGESVLLKDSLIQVLETAVQVEEAVEL